MIIELLNGTRYDIANYNLKRLFHNIPSANIVNNNYELQGRSDIITDSRYNNRVISVEFLYETKDIFDYYLLRSELNNLFMRNESFYIIFKREPYKRWLVRNNSQFEVPAHPYMNSFIVEFITENFYAESVGTSLDLQNRKEWDVDLWSWNGNIDWDNNYSYTFNNTEFIVNNFGNINVDPRISNLNINVRGLSNQFVQLTNRTTGDVYRYNGTLTENDTLILTGARTLKNNVSEFANTNMRLLNLAVGQNDFIIEGISNPEVTFDFRFLFK